MTFDGQSYLFSEFLTLGKQTKNVLQISSVFSPEVFRYDRVKVEPNGLLPFLILLQFGNALIQALFASCFWCKKRITQNPFIPILIPFRLITFTAGWNEIRYFGDEPCRLLVFDERSQVIPFG